MKKNLIISLITLSIFCFSCKKDDNSITTSNVITTATSGIWKVTYFWDNNKDETINFSGYSFTFNTNGSVFASKNGSSIIGSWSTGNDDSRIKLNLSFSAPRELIDISDDWHVMERTDIKIRLHDISGGNGTVDYLTFEKK